MDINLKPSQRVGYLGGIVPVSQAAGTVTTGWIDATLFHNYLSLIECGVLGASATVDAKLQQAQDNAGTNAKDVTGKAITQLTKAANDTGQATIDLKQEDLDIANGFKFFRLSVTVGTATSLIAAAIFGLDHRYGVATGDQAATVAQNL